jgi:hypothetical protein
MEALNMNGMRNLSKIVEATRLTRAGRLTEATGLLRRMLRGETAPDPTSRTARAVPHAPALADMTLASAATTARPPTVARLGTWVDRVKGLRSGRGLHRLAEPAPASTPDIVPPGGRFIEAAYGNPAGSRAYKLYIPSGYHGQALPLVVMLHGCTQSPDDFAAGTRMNVVAEERT